MEILLLQTTRENVVFSTLLSVLLEEMKIPERWQRHTHALPPQLPIADPSWLRQGLG